MGDLYNESGTLTHYERIVPYVGTRICILDEHYNQLTAWTKLQPHPEFLRGLLFADFDPKMLRGEGLATQYLLRQGERFERRELECAVEITSETNPIHLNLGA